MALLDKLMFWKKKEPDFGLAAGPDLGLDFGMPGAPNLGIPGGAPGFGMPEEQKPDFGFARPADMTREEIPAEVRNAPAFGGAFSPQPAQAFQQQQAAQSHDLQVIYAKLDAVRAMLDTIDQRIRNIERMEEMRERERGRW